MTSRTTWPEEEGVHHLPRVVRQGDVGGAVQQRQGVVMEGALALAGEGEGAPGAPAGRVEEGERGDGGEEREERRAARHGATGLEVSCSGFITSRHVEAPDRDTDILNYRLYTRTEYNYIDKS